MSTVTLKGNPVHTSGELPAVGSKAPNFQLIASDLSEKSMEDFAGKKIVLNIFPSIDTGVCAQSVRQFNQEAANLDNTVVLCVSQDLPFALQRFCAAEGIDNVTSLSGFRSNFGEDYGIKLTDSPLKNLLGRAVVTINENQEVQYTELVNEITQEPNYAAALQSLK